MHRTTYAQLARLLGGDLAGIVLDYEDETGLVTDERKIGVGLEIKLFGIRGAGLRSLRCTMSEIVFFIGQELRQLRLLDDYEVWIDHMCARVARTTGRKLAICATRRTRQIEAVRYASDLLTYECICGSRSEDIGRLLSARHWASGAHRRELFYLQHRLGDDAARVFS
jgi:hypothetical protein